MRNLNTDKVAVFKCNKWMSKSHEDGVIVRELAAEIEGKKIIEGQIQMCIFLRFSFALS